MENKKRRANVMTEDPRLLDRGNALVNEAFLRIASTCPGGYPNKRFDQIGHSLWPGQMAVRLTLNCHDAGADPRLLTLAGHALVQFARSLRSSRITADHLRLVSCEEEIINGRVNGHQVALTGNESPQQLERIEHDIALQIEALHDILRATALLKRQLLADEAETQALRHEARVRVRAARA